MDALAPTPALSTERIHHDSEGTEGHRFRYHLAAGFLEPGDVVLDAACGAGYGAQILLDRGNIVYAGVDRDISEAPPVGLFVEADLREWVPGFAFDVFVGFETIEHLSSYEHYVNVAKQARRWIIVSTPIVPTTHLNPHHCHNFAPGQLASLFIDEDWTYFQGVVQPAELSEIYVFRRR